MYFFRLMGLVHNSKSKVVEWHPHLCVKEVKTDMILGYGHFIVNVCSIWECKAC